MKARESPGGPVSKIPLPLDLKLVLLAVFCHLYPAPLAMPRPVRVLLADDHPLLRKGVADLLREHGGIDVVGEADDGEHAVELALKTRPDIIVMDVSMPRVDGLEATRRITALLPETRVIGLSTHEYEDMGDTMIAAGAREYLTKAQTAESLVATILRVAHA